MALSSGDIFAGDTISFLTGCLWLIGVGVGRRVGLGLLVY